MRMTLQIKMKAARAGASVNIDMSHPDISHPSFFLTEYGKLLAAFLGLSFWGSKF